VLARRGWYSGAEDELQKVIQLQPNFADAHYNLALLYLQQTPPAVELARRHYQMALELGATPDADVAAKLAAAPVQTTLP
jgi:Tfp pilus assembly protein PilF